MSGGGGRVYRPICVARMLTGCDDTVYGYYFYCGSCRRLLGGLGHRGDFCQWCCAGVASYVFADGYEKHHPSREFAADTPFMPETWEPS